MSTIVPPPRWTFHNHAWGRMAEMGVSRQEVLDVLAAPEFTRPGSIEHTLGHDRRIAVGGRLAVVTMDSVVLTVLWRDASGRDDRLMLLSSEVRVEW